MPGAAPSLTTAVAAPTPEAAVVTGPSATTGSGPRSVGPRYGAGFWLAAAAFLTAMAFSTIPTPLYGLYQQRDSFSSVMVTVVFAVYAVGVVVSLLLAGQVSDWVGRKRVLVSGLGIEVLAAALFIVWPALAGLLVARFVSGLGIGMTTATATAYLRDLHARSRPGSGVGRFEAVSTAANIGGLGLGTLASGTLAQFAPSPLWLPYAVFAVLLALAAAGLALAPETVDRPTVRPRYHPQHVTAGQGDRASYAMAAAGTFVGFAIFGLFTSLAPGFVGATLHHPSRLLAGVVSFVTFGAAAVAQTATGRLRPRARMIGGIFVAAAGLVVVAVGMEAVNLPAFLIGGGLAGAGAGVMFKSALAILMGGAPSSKRSEVAASLFLVAYTGLIIPVLGIGIATVYMPAPTAMLFFTGALLAILACQASLILKRPESQRPTRVDRPGSLRGGRARGSQQDRWRVLRPMWGRSVRRRCGGGPRVR
jgi:MFS family permease